MQCKYDISFIDDNHEWVVFLHGVGGSAAMWHKQLKFLKEYFNTCVITLPSHGSNTSTVSVNSENLYKTVAKGIIAHLKSLNIKEIYMVSFSMGTIVANEMFAQEPSFIKKSLLTGMIYNINRFVYLIAKICIKLIDLVPFDWLVKICARIVLPLKSHKTSRKFLIKDCMRMQKCELVIWAKALINNIFYLDKRENILDKDKCLLVIGDEDYMFKNKIVKLCKKYSLPLIILSQCNHACSLCKWKEFNAILFNFLMGTGSCIQ